MCVTNGTYSHLLDHLKFKVRLFIMNRAKATEKRGIRGIPSGNLGDPVELGKLRNVFLWCFVESRKYMLRGSLSNPW